MEIKELEKFAEAEIKELDRKYGVENDKEKDSWAYALKIGEELGELYDELLSHKGYQRKEKMKEFDKKEIEKEIADVLISTIILAKNLKIDINDLLEKRLLELHLRKKI